MNPTVREAEAADVPTVEVVRRQAMEAGFEGVYDRADFAPLVASPSADLPSWVTAADHLALVVETDVTVVAFGVLDVPAGQIRALYTAPEYQRRGCASALLARFETRAADDGADTISVVTPRNAVGFFESRGFERQEPVERDGLACSRLTKPLA